MLNRIIYLLCVSAVILFGLVGCGEEPDKESVVKWTNPQTETQKSSTEGGITDTSTSIIWSDQAPLEEKKEVAVYVTRTGTRYHRDGCGSLSKSKMAITLKKAKEDYFPCKVCKPVR